MLHKTKGIVLHILPYNDAYNIINMYTENFGRMSYLASNARGKKTKVSRALLQPLSILDMEVEHLNSRSIQRIKEIKSAHPLFRLQNHPVKSAIALFLAEVLYRVIQEREVNRPLFEYLHDSIQWLDLAEEGIANFHLTFLIRLSSYIGVHPDGKTYRSGYFFDLMNGIFTEKMPEHPHYLNKEDSLVFERLLRINYKNMAVYSFSGQERSRIIRHILNYYRLHLPGLPEIKSLAVMQSLF